MYLSLQDDVYIYAVMWTSVPPLFVSSFLPPVASYIYQQVNFTLTLSRGQSIRIYYKKSWCSSHSQRLSTDIDKRMFITSIETSVIHQLTLNVTCEGIKYHCQNMREVSYLEWTIGMAHVIIGHIPWHDKSKYGWICWFIASHNDTALTIDSLKISKTVTVYCFYRPGI